MRPYHIPPYETDEIPPTVSARFVDQIEDGIADTGKDMMWKQIKRNENIWKGIKFAGFIAGVTVVMLVV